MPTRKIVVTSSQIVQDVYNPATPNSVICCTCQEVLFTAQNIHNTLLRLDSIDGLDGVAGVDFTGLLLEVNGNPPTFPVYLNPGQSFSFLVSICSLQTSNDGYIKFDFITIEHGAEGFYYLPLSCVDMSTFISPQPIDFGSVTYGGSGSQNVTITNTTIGAFDWEVVAGFCEGHNFTFAPDNGTLPPGASTICVITWTPTSIDEVLQCSFLFGFCKTPDIRIEVTGQSVQDCSCLCCNQVTIATENGLLRDIDGLCGTSALVTSTIADKKMMKFEFTYQNGISDGVQIWFNPILFAFVCDFSGVLAPPAVAWFVEYDNTMTDGVAVPMNLIGAGSNSLNQMNFNVQFVPTNAATGDFQILFDFFLVSDFETLINATTFANNIKFKRNVATSLTDWANTLPSVYNANKRLCSMIYLRDPNVLVDGAAFECIETNSIRFSARWFNLGLYNGASEFNSPSFNFTRSVGGVTNFSTIEQTEVTFDLTIPSIYGGASGIILQMFDESQFNNSVDFLTNYDSSRAQILNVGTSGVIDNHFNSPSTFANVAPNVWRVTCFVDTTINPSSTYRIAAVVYANDTITANTFLSDPISVTEQPDPDCGCAPKVVSEFDQLFQSQFTDCLQPAPKERIQHRLKLDSGAFKDCLDNWGALLSDWREYLTRITLTIYKRSNAFPTATQTTFFVVGQHVSNRVAGFPGGWQNLNDLIVQDAGSALIETSFLTRVRWEQTPFNGQVLVAPTAQYLNRTNAGALSSTYISTNAVTNSWIEEDVFFEYRFEFDLSSVFGAGYSWNIVQAFKVNAIDFEPDNSGFSPIILEALIEGLSITSGTWQEISGTFCPTDFSSIRVTYKSSEEGDFVFFLEKAPFGLPYIQESEVNSSPFGIPLLSIPGVTYQDAVFDGSLTAKIEFDPSVFTGLNEVDICGYISTPPAVLVCEYFQSLGCQGGSGLACAILGGGFMTLTGSGASNGRYRQFVIDDGTIGFPVPGSTYVVEYSCSVPPQKAVNFWAGLGQSIRTPDFTIPIGATSGTISFVWGGTDTIGRIYAKLGASATPFTSVITLRFGTAACP